MWFDFPSSLGTVPGERVVSPRLEGFSLSFVLSLVFPIVSPGTGPATTPYRPREAGLRSVKLHLVTSVALLCIP